MIRVRSILLPLVTLAALAAPAAAVPEQLGLTARVVDAGAPITGNHVVTVRLHTAASDSAMPRNKERMGMVTSRTSVTAARLAGCCDVVVLGRRRAHRTPRAYAGSPNRRGGRRAGAAPPRSALDAAPRIARHRVSLRYSLMWRIAERESPL